MAKRKRNSGGQSSFINKLGVILLVAILLMGCYFFLKRENKLPSSLENVKVEKIWNKTVSETGQLTDNLLVKVEEGLESAKTTIEKGRKVAKKASDSFKEEVNGLGQDQKGNPNSTTRNPQSSQRPHTTPKGQEEGVQNENLKPGSLNLKLEIPVATREQDEIILKRMAYTASYNNKMKNPNWVAWELTRKEIEGTQERTDKFIPDPDLPEPRVKTSDYTKTGYDRGHMAPAADMKWSLRAMEESFYMSNICPQHKNLNRGDWNDLEDACRAWAKKYGTVYIACGPIYDRAKPKRIGAAKVAVPDRFFKVVLIYNRKDPMALGFVFPNIAHSQDLDKYQVTVDDIEHMTGLDFFSKLPDHVEDYIEAEIRPLPSTKR